MARIWNAITRNSEYAGLVIEEDAGEFQPVCNGMTLTRQPSIETALRVISLATGKGPLVAAERPSRIEDADDA